MDGHALPQHVRQRFYDEETNGRVYKRKLSDTEIGCYLSHIAVWRRIAESEDPAMVLEDDFRLDSETLPFIDALPARLKRRSLIKLSTAKRQKFNRKALLERRGRKLRSYRIISPHTTGYVIGPEAAAAMLAARKRFFRPVDIDLKHVWEHGVPIYGVDPPLVRERGDLDSIIGPDRSAAKSSHHLVRLAANTRYQLRFHLNRLRHSVLIGSRTRRDDGDEAE